MKRWKIDEKAMIKTVPALLLIGAISLASTAGKAQSQPDSISAEQLTEQTADAVFKKQFHPKTMVGCSVVVMRDGKIVLAKGYGKATLAGSDPVTLNTRFAIGSVTKQFTSACILLLAEEGRLSVHDRVSKYYPHLTRANDITLLDLMNHVSGYTDYYPLDFVDRRMQKPIAPDRLLDLYARQKLDFEPGTRWSYSNTGYILLSRVVERVSKQSLGQFLQTRLFGPFGMTHTIYEPRQRRESYAAGYAEFVMSGPEPAAPEAAGWAGGAGAIYSTPTDLAKWDLALMDGKVLKPDSCHLMMMPRWLKDGSATRYGCGLEIRTRNGVTILKHNGGVSGFAALNVMVPATRSALIYCLNNERDNLGAEGLILPALLPVVQISQAASKAKETESLSSPAPPSVPVIPGDSAEAVARQFFLGLQKGTMEGVPLGEEFQYYMNKKRLDGASSRLKALGDLTKVTVFPPSERGGMAVCDVVFTLGGRTMGGVMYRSTDGKIQQLLPTLADSSGQSRIETREISSTALANNRVGMSPLRKFVVYLPAGYDETSAGKSKRYPVIYFLPAPFESYRTLFDQNDAHSLFDRANAAGVVDKFIFVSVDMNTPLGCSWYVNSPVTGNWEDFLIKELVPYIDTNFHTIRHRDSRGIAGDFMGGYGAIRFGMKYPNVFGSVYALGPVGTGSGVQTMYSRPDWDLLANAKSLGDLTQNGFWANIFVTIFQAYLPNPDKPPLFIDMQAQKVGDQLVVDTKLTERLRTNFLLETMIPQYADNLKSLRALKFDWSRSDPNFDHVFSNQAFTHKLNEFGIAHEAEEYNGLWNRNIWSQEGRIYTDVLPFFARHLVFDTGG